MEVNDVFNPMLFKMFADRRPKLSFHLTPLHKEEERLNFHLCLGKQNPQATAEGSSSPPQSPTVHLRILFLPDGKMFEAKCCLSVCVGACVSVFTLHAGQFTLTRI